MSIETTKISIKTALSGCLGRDFLEFDEADQFIAELSEHAEEVAIDQEQYLFLENDPVKHIYISISGALMLERTTGNGARHIFAFVFTGNLLGISEQHEYSYSAKALSNASAIKLDVAFLDDIFERYPQIAKRLHSRTNKILSQILDQLFVVGQKTAHQRLAWFLLDIYQRNGDGKGHVHLPMSRRDIADYLGMSIETTCRGLNKLLSMDMMSIKDIYWVTILDLDGLKDFSEGIERLIPRAHHG